MEELPIEKIEESEKSAALEEHVDQVLLADEILTPLPGKNLPKLQKALSEQPELAALGRSLDGPKALQKQPTMIEKE